jgi:cohesin loading factor subunit SCC2
VELIGKYVLQSPEVADDYYDRIADRILVSTQAALFSLTNDARQDTGLGVRKRVIKLFKVFYTSTTDNARRTDISARLVHRMLDEDDGVKVWIFPSTIHIPILSRILPLKHWRTYGLGPNLS